MNQPLIYISFGMAKAGSALAFNLVSAILEEAGVAQDDLDLRDGDQIDQPRYVNVIRPQELQHIYKVARARPKGPIVVKTHSGLWAKVAEAMDEGHVIGHAICRDPRDVALAMMDASRANKPWGKRDGQPLRHVEDALDYIRGHAGKFEDWARHPAILPLSYERAVFDTESVAAELARQLGVETDVKRVAKMAKAATVGFSAGKPRRHETELGPEVSAKIREEFAHFIDTWCDPAFEPPKRGWLSRLRG